jgi:DNA processing protein
MDEHSPQPPDNLESWLLVSQCSGIGSRYFQRLMAHFGEPEKILSASRASLVELGIPQDTIKNLKNRSTADIQATLTWLTTPEHQLITLADSRYPPLLKEIDGPPPLLYLIGNSSLLYQPQIAIVGSRNPSPNGIENARNFAATLAAAGICITSGLAEGIDGAAHRGALKSGETIAVMGTGPDRVYPSIHRDLAHQIAKKGLLISEFPPGTPAKAENFPRRNRIISGLSLGTLVVEAALQSGSLITARLTSEQGREVFAIPGSIHNPQAKGCHALIRQGAKLVESAQDIVEELAALIGVLQTHDSSDKQPDESQRSPQTDPDYLCLIENMGYDPVSVDELIARTGLTAEAVSSMLLLLELQGDVSSAPGGLYSRTHIQESRSCGREST